MSILLQTLLGILLLLNIIVSVRRCCISGKVFSLVKKAGTELQPLGTSIGSLLKELPEHLKQGFGE